MATTKTASHTKEKTTSSPATATAYSGVHGRRSSRPSTPDREPTANYLKPTVSSRSGGGTAARPSFAAGGKRVISSKNTTVTKTLPATTRTPSALTSSSARPLRAPTSTSTSHSPSPKNITGTKEKAAPVKGVAASGRAQLTRAKSFDKTSGGGSTSRNHARSGTPPPPAKNPPIEVAGEEILNEIVEVTAPPQPPPSETKKEVVEEEATSATNVDVREVENLFHEEPAEDMVKSGDVAPPPLVAEIVPPENHAKEETEEKEEKVTENITEVTADLTDTVPTIMADDGAGKAPEVEKEEIAAVEVVEKKVESPPAQSAPTSTGRRKEAPPAGNAVIEERMVAEKRKNKVLALVGAFETVISLQEPDIGGAAQNHHRATSSVPEKGEENEETEDELAVPK